VKWNKVFFLLAKQASMGPLRKLETQRRHVTTTKSEIVFVTDDSLIGVFFAPLSCFILLVVISH
jgi:hypothetical protein